MPFTFRVGPRHPSVIQITRGDRRATELPALWDAAPGASGPTGPAVLQAQTVQSPAARARLWHVYPLRLDRLTLGGGRAYSSYNYRNPRQSKCKIPPQN